jgi:hypothetical protein
VVDFQDRPWSDAAASRFRYIVVEGGEFRHEMNLQRRRVDFAIRGVPSEP